MLLQKRAKYESVSSEYFPPSQLEVVYRDVISSLKLPQALDIKVYMSTKTITQNYYEHNISNLKARHFLLGFAMTINAAERATILAVESLLLMLKYLDVVLLIELELAASYIHPPI